MWAYLEQTYAIDKNVLFKYMAFWEVMLHRPYSPDLAPSDYYLFRFLQKSSNGKTFNDGEAVKSHLVSLSFLPIKTRSSMSVEL